MTVSFPGALSLSLPRRPGEGAADGGFGQTGDVLRDGGEVDAGEAGRTCLAEVHHETGESVHIAEIETRADADIERRTDLVDDEVA
jgi:hypothetical protein